MSEVDRMGVMRRCEDGDDQRLAAALRDGDEGRLRVILHANGYEWAAPVESSDEAGAVAGAERYLSDALKMFDAGSPTSARAYVDSALADLRRVGGQ